MTTYRPLRQDPITQEHFYNNKWYDSYPSEQIKANEEAMDEYWEWQIDRKQDKK